MTRTAATTLDHTARLPRRGRVGLVVFAVACVHAAVLTSLESPRAPSGRGQAVVASALVVRLVAMPALQQAPVPEVHHAAVPEMHHTAAPKTHHVDAAVGRGDASTTTDADAPEPSLPSLPSVAPAPLRIVVADAKPATATRVAASNTKPSQPAHGLPQRAAVERRPTAAAVAATAARTPPAANTAALSEVPARAAPDAALRHADAFEGAPAASAADALLPDHLLRTLPTYAVRLPPSQRLHFRVSRGAARGEGTLDWSLHDDGRYSAALRLRGEGMPGVDWTSEGDAAGAAGVQPRRMVAHRKGRAVAAANFALDEQKVSFSGARVERPFVRGGQDRLTWMLQLAGVLEAREQPMRDDERIVLYVVGPRGAADLWQWRVAGRETLGEGAGAVPTVKLVREAQRLYDTEIELWLDPLQHHLPLRWRQQQRGVERSALEWERVPG